MLCGHEIVFVKFFRAAFRSGEVARSHLLAQSLGTRATRGFPFAFVFGGIVLIRLCNLAIDTFAEEIAVFESRHHAVGITGAHIEKRISRKQVDAPHIDARASDFGIEHVDEIGSEEAIRLAEVDV